MKTHFLILLGALLLNSQISFSQNIFKQHGINNKPLTLSDGQYSEFFNNDEIIQIGTVLFNTTTYKIVAFSEEDSAKAKYNAELSSRWFAIDPLAEKYQQISPYTYVENNPIIYLDPNGQYKISAQDQKKSEVLTNYLTNNVSEILQSDAIMGGLSKYGQLSADAVKTAITMGNGPSLQIVDDLPMEASGYYTGGKDGTIQISQSIVDQLNSSSGDDAQAALLLVVSTILHETVHYGDNQDGTTSDNQEVQYKEVTINGETVKVWMGSEKGQLFESEVYRNGEFGETVVNMDDAKKVAEEKNKSEEDKKVLPTVP